MDDVKRKRADTIHYPCLTTHHNFKVGETKTSILGKDRTYIIESIVRDICKPSPQQAFIKELFPYHFITASQRQGKSLILDLVCERLREEGHFALCITYTSITAFDVTVDSPD